MKIEQFEDKSLAHYSYAILSECDMEIILVDPARNPQPYYDYADQHYSKIVGVIETHPHADFVSCHLEIAATTGATIYVSKKAGAFYEHRGFDDGQSIEIGKIKLTAINTPGHSPDSISILLEHRGVPKAVFTGDTLFIGDCGRPDLRETVGGTQLSKNELAKMMYHTLRSKLAVLNDDVIVYPAHGAGTLCGKNLSNQAESTIGIEKQTNWSLQPQTEEEFVTALLAHPPFIPAYFPFDVELNRKGAPSFKTSIQKINFTESVPYLDKHIFIIDTRPHNDFKQGHLPNSINIMKGDKFETWLGSIIKPTEPFYLTGKNKEDVCAMIERAAAIGYEAQLQRAFVLREAPFADEKLNLADFRNNTDDYTIVDVRNNNEVTEKKFFDNAISIPLGELRGRVAEIPTDRPIVVHCAGGYRSAAGASLLKSVMPATTVVFDLGEAITGF